MRTQSQCYLLVYTSGCAPSCRSFDEAAIMNRLPPKLCFEMASPPPFTPLHLRVPFGWCVEGCTLTTPTLRIKLQQDDDYV